MGASGSGKTTLLDVLSDRISSRNLTGEISLNGAPVKGDTIRRLSAYVMQDDLMFPALTVRETLMYAAELRLPPTVSRVEKAEKVRRLIRLLGLTKVENSKIGDENNRGISGGERKRVAIGVEMIGDPKILFLDEPTSGLDSTSAFRVVKVIKRIAPAQLPEFLSAFGCPPPPFANPTEFALDVIQRLGHETEGGAKRGDDVDGEDDDEEEYDMDGTEIIKCHVAGEAAPKRTNASLARQPSGNCCDGEKETEGESKTGIPTDKRDGIQRLADFYTVWSQGGSSGVGDSSRGSSEGGESFSIPPSSPSTCFSPDQAAVAAATAAAVAARTAAAAAAAAAAVAAANGNEMVTIPTGGSPGGTSGASPDARVAETYSGGGGAASAQMGFLGEHQSAGAAQLQPLGERNCAGEGAQTEHCGERKYANGWWRELRVLMSRSVRVIARTPALYLLRLLLIMVTGLLIASLFWRPPFNAEGLHERLAFISFLVCTLFFSSADATPLFIQVCHSAWNGVQSNTTLSPTYMLAWAPYMVYSPLHVLMALAITAKSWWHIFSPGSTLSQSIFHPFPPLRIPGLHTVFLLFDPNHLQERNIFIRETSQHAYRPSTYMVASTLVYLPLHVLMALAITAESWCYLHPGQFCTRPSELNDPLLSLLPPLVSPIPSLLPLLSRPSPPQCHPRLCHSQLNHGQLCPQSTSLSFPLSLPSPSSSVILAYAIVISTMANFALVCGFYIQRQSIPPFWIWLHYLSPVKYAYEAVTLNEFAAAGPSTCYQPAGDLFAATPLSVLLSPAQVNQSLAVLRPALARTPFTDLSVSTCLQTGPELLVYSLGLTQMSKWECVAVLVGIGCVLRLLHWLLLVRLSRTKRG
ncbi:unnamed protein product [Closterium sp. NIES-64]|nr:unnamed protein product [Closterium sp. NIES-64]